MISAKDKVVDVSKQSYSTMVSKGKVVKSRVADKFENMINNAENRNQELNNKYKAIEIISQGNNFIEIKNVAGASDKDLNIIFKKDNIELPIKIKLDR